jgi:membrane protein YdbS with pleckstrin-like domain
MKKSLLLSSTAVFCVILIMVLFLLSAKYGNLARQINGGNKELKMISEFFLVSAKFLIPYCAFAAASDVPMYISDAKTGWTRFSIALPVSTKTKALAHTLFFVMRSAVSFVFSVIAVASAYAATGNTFSADALADIGVVYIFTLLFIIPCEFAQSLPKTETDIKKRQIKVIMSITGLGALLGVYISKVTAKYVQEYAAAHDGNEELEMIPQPFKDKYFALRNAAAPFILPVIILLIIGLYFIVKKNLDKQKKL